MLAAASADVLQHTGAEPKLAAGIGGEGGGEREEAAQTWAGRAVEGVRLQLTPGGWGGLLNDGG